MSKSLGNLVFVSDLLEVADPRAIRLALMRHHYRAGFEWYDTDLDEGTALLHRLARGGAAPTGPDPRPFADAGARTRSTTTSTRRRRSRRSTTSPARCSRAGRRRRARERSATSAALVGRRPHANRSRLRLTARRSTGADGAHPRPVAGTPLVPSPVPWPTRITITLPDGSSREVEAGATPADVAASIGTAAGQGRPGGQGRRRVGGTSTARSPATRAVEIVDPGQRRRAVRCCATPPRTCWPRPSPTCSPARGTRSARPSTTASTTTSSCPAARTSPRTTSSASRPACARSSRPTSRSCATRSTATEGEQVFADQPYKLDIIEKVDASEVGEGELGRLRSTATRGADGSDVRRPVPGSARAVHRSGSVRSSSCGSRAPTGGATRRARSSSGSTARRGSRRRRSPSTSTGSRRPSGATTARLGAELDLFSFPDEIGSGLAVFHPKGGARPQGDGGLLAPSRTRPAGYAFVNSPHITKANLFETSGHLDWFADGMFPPMHLDEGGGDDGTTYYLEADELPVPHPDLPQSDALVPRAAAAVLRVRDRVPLRAVGRGARAHPGARHDPGRRAHLLHEGADARRARHACCTSCSTCSPTTASTTSTSSCRPSPRARPSGSDEEWDEATETLRVAARGDGPRAGARRGRRRVLRAEDLGAGARRDRSHVAGVDHPGRLPAPAALRPALRRAPTTSATGRS